MNVIVCEPDPSCVDPNSARWHCMRGHDGAEPGVCPLVRCEPSDGWWWEPVSEDAPDDEAWLRGVINGNPAPDGVETFAGVLVTL